MANFSVKAYLETETGVEVRRFAVTKADAKRFGFVYDTLLSIYGQTLKAEDGFAVYWKDDEGDEIRASSDDEIAYAVKCCKEDTLKLYLRKLKPNPSSAPRKTAAGEHHPGVVCDACDKEIYGFRYKCMQCPNFDLCSGCEQAGHHADHSMMRIPSSLKPGFRGGYHFRPHRHWRHWQKHAEKCNGEGRRQSCEGRRFGEPFHPYNLLSKMWSAFGGMPADFMNQQAGAATAGTQTNEASSSDSANKEKKFHENETEMDGNRSAEEYLRNVGETVAAALDPFGIDVLIDVEHNGKRENVNRQSFEQAGTNNQAPTAPEKESSTLDAETGVSASQTGFFQKGPSESETGIYQEAVAAATTAAAAAAAAALESLKNSNIDPSDWTCLDFTENDKTEEDPMETMPEMMANVNISNEPLHPNPLIALKAEQMMAMGFNNFHGWLTSLLVLTDGNIERIFDILSDLGQHGEPSREFIETFVALLDRYHGDAAKVVAILQSSRK